MATHDSSLLSFGQLKLCYHLKNFIRVLRHTIHVQPFFLNCSIVKVSSDIVFAGAEKLLLSQFLSFRVTNVNKMMADMSYVNSPTRSPFAFYLQQDSCSRNMHVLRSNTPICSWRSS